MSRLTKRATKPEALSVIDQIKKSTAELHLRLESQTLLAAIMLPTVSQLQYCHYLNLMRKVEEVYEQKILAELAGTFPGLKRSKASQLISDDLDNIGVTPPLGPDVKNYLISGAVTIPFALGFMYVMEGSKLGGKVIYRHIHRALGYSENCGAKFVADYGNNTFDLWKEFLSHFSAYVAKNDCEEEAIQGAKYAFSSIYDFFESNRLMYED